MMKKKGNNVMIVYAAIIIVLLVGGFIVYEAYGQNPPPARNPTAFEQNCINAISAMSDERLELQEPDWKSFSDGQKLQRCLYLEVGDVVTVSCVDWKDSSYCSNHRDSRMQDQYPEGSHGLKGVVSAIVTVDAHGDSLVNDNLSLEELDTLCSEGTYNEERAYKYCHFRAYVVNIESCPELNPLESSCTVFDRQSLKKSNGVAVFVGSLFPSDVSESEYRTESNMTELRGLIVP